MIAALYVERNGIYSGLDDVELWDEQRDARLYAGPWPVVAHPPCSRWCRLAGLVEARWGHKKGDDGGTFAAALKAVRTFGGVLEHPAYSDAWRAFGLPTPKRNGGWFGNARIGHSTHVEQNPYGHPAKKATWLYAFGCELPRLKWGSDLDTRSTALVSWCGNHTRREYAQINHGETRPGRKHFRQRISKKAASATPIEFRDALIAMARSVSEQPVRASERP